MTLEDRREKLVKELSECKDAAQVYTQKAQELGQRVVFLQGAIAVLNDLLRPEATEAPAEATPSDPQSPVRKLSRSERRRLEAQLAKLEKEAVPADEPV